MNRKVLSGAVAAVMLLIFLGSIVVKLKEPSLAVVALIGVGMMLWELAENIRGRDD